MPTHNRASESILLGRLRVPCQGACALPRRVGKAFQPFNPFVLLVAYRRTWGRSPKFPQEPGPPNGNCPVPWGKKSFGPGLKCGRLCLQALNTNPAFGYDERAARLSWKATQEWAEQMLPLLTRDDLGAGTIKIAAFLSLCFENNLRTS